MRPRLRPAWRYERSRPEAEPVIIDAHVHVVDEIDGRTKTGATRSLGYGKVRWGSEELQLLTPCSNPTAFSAETLIAHMDWAGVDKAVLLQGGFYGDKNAYVAAAVARWPDRLVGAGYFDPCAAGGAAGVPPLRRRFRVRHHQAGVERRDGFCRPLSGAPRSTDEQLSWIWADAERLDLIMVLDLGAVDTASYQTDALRSILDRHPALRIVIAHLAQPPVSRAGDPELDGRWQSQLLLARSPNVWFDLASLPAYAAPVEDFPFPTSARYVERAVGLVGADKLLWGTDVPGALSVATYPQLQAFIARHCEFLSAREREKILGENAETLYFARLILLASRDRRGSRPSGIRRSASFARPVLPRPGRRPSGRRIRPRRAGTRRAQARRTGPSRCSRRRSRSGTRRPCPPSCHRYDPRRSTARRGEATGARAC